MPRDIPHTSNQKGHAIRVVAGKYAGRKGWLHKGYEETEEKIYVILAATGSKKEEAKQIYKKSIEYGTKNDPIIWEEAMLCHKKVEPAYKAFLNKILEAEFKPTPQLMALIYYDLNQKYAARQVQSRSTGYIRVKSSCLQHPDKRKEGEGTEKFAKLFKELYVRLEARGGGGDMA